MRINKCFLHALACLSSLSLTDGRAISVNNIDTALEMWTNNKELAVRRYGLIEKWKLVGFQDLDDVFWKKGAFNADLTRWDVSAVTSAQWTFNLATKFNGDISEWNVGKLENADNMFWQAESFNRNVADWDVSSLTSMVAMFAETLVFNQDLNAWDVSAVTNMEEIFWAAKAFNTAISKWDVSNVENMDAAFYEAAAFNKNIDWEMGKITTLESFFYKAETFNADISGWDTSSVTDLYSCFEEAYVFNSDINNWDVSRVFRMDYLFYYTAFNTPLDSWDTASLNSAIGAFQVAEEFNQDISSWNTLELKNANSMFVDAISFNQDLSEWRVNRLMDAEDMFYYATDFNQKICWDLPIKTITEGMFSDSSGEISCCKDDKDFFLEKFKNVGKVTCADIHDETLFSRKGEATRWWNVCLEETTFKGKNNRVGGFCPEACDTLCVPTDPPTAGPTNTPTESPTKSPTSTPTKSPTGAPTAGPTPTPTKSPTTTPTKSPTGSPTAGPTNTPTKSPTATPTESPTGAPTEPVPTYFRTRCKDDKSFKKECRWVARAPVKRCHMINSDSGEKYRVHCNTMCGCVEYTPTSSPTDTPTSSPTGTPTHVPTSSPTSSPTHVPTSSPTASPTHVPTSSPTASPTHVPTSSPTDSPSTTEPTADPTGTPTFRPTTQPTTPEPTAGPTHARTDRPTKRKINCKNSNFEVSAVPLGYTGTISCDVVHLFKRGCKKKVHVNEKRKVIRNLCPGKCKRECLDNTVKKQNVEPYRTKTPILSCDNKKRFRVEGIQIKSSGWVSCGRLQKYENIDVCAQEVKFKGESKMIRDFCPGKCKSECCVDFDKLYLKLKNRTERVACNNEQIGSFCNEEVLTDWGAENTKVKDWCPNACGSTCVSMPTPKSRVDSGLLRRSAAPSTSDVPTIM